MNRNHKCLILLVTVGFLFSLFLLSCKVPHQPNKVKIEKPNFSEQLGLSKETLAWLLGRCPDGVPNDVPSPKEPTVKFLVDEHNPIVRDNSKNDPEVIDPDYQLVSLNLNDTIDLSPFTELEKIQINNYHSCNSIRVSFLDTKNRINPNGNFVNDLPYSTAELIAFLGQLNADGWLEFFISYRKQSTTLTLPVENGTNQIEIVLLGRCIEYSKEPNTNFDNETVLDENGNPEYSCLNHEKLDEFTLLLDVRQVVHTE